MENGKRISASAILLALIALGIGANTLLAQSGQTGAVILPDARKIIDAFPADAEQIAALRMMSGLAEGAASPDTAAKLGEYRAAERKIDPATNARNHERMEKAVSSLLENKRFQYEVLRRFAPARAGLPPGALGRVTPERVRGENQQMNFVIVATALAILAFPLLYVLLIGERDLQAWRQRNPDPNYPFQLPESLSVASAFRKSISLEFDCGMIYKRIVFKSVAAGNVGSSADPNSPHPALNYANSGSGGGMNYEYHFRAPDGHQGRRDLTGEAFLATPGQLTSVITSNTKLVACYNHSTGAFTSFPVSNLQMKGRGLWWWTVAIAILGTAALFEFVLPGTVQERDPRTVHLIWILPVLFGIGSAIYLFVLTTIVGALRQRSFKFFWIPRLQKFMAERTPYLKPCYTQAERDAAFADRSYLLGTTVLKDLEGSLRQDRE